MECHGSRVMVIPAILVIPAEAGIHWRWQKHGARQLGTFMSSR